MAKRDFAQLQTPAKKPESRTTPAVMAGVSLVFTAVLAFSGGYMVGDTRNASDTLKAEKAALQDRVGALQKHVDELETQLAKSREKPKPPTPKDAAERVGDLTFYSELPKQQVMPSPLGDTGPAAVQQHRGEDIEAYANLPPPVREPKAAQGAAAPASGAAGSPTASYRVQAGSFIRRSDAEGLLNRMALAGIKAKVSQAQVPNVGTRYRVFTASVTGMAEAEGLKSLLRDKLGIEGLLMRE